MKGVYMKVDNVQSRQNFGMALKLKGNGSFHIAEALVKTTLDNEKFVMTNILEPINRLHTDVFCAGETIIAKGPGMPSVVICEPPSTIARLGANNKEIQLQKLNGDFESVPCEDAKSLFNFFENNPIIRKLLAAREFGKEYDNTALQNGYTKTMQEIKETDIRTKANELEMLFG